MICTQRTASALLPRPVLLMIRSPFFGCERVRHAHDPPPDRMEHGAIRLNVIQADCQGSRVTDRRRYSTALRAEQTKLARRRILAAAARMFAERGYLGTTLADIA